MRRRAFFPVKRSTAQTTKSEERILVLEPDESLLSSILSVLHEVAPEAVVDVAHDMDEAHRLASGEPVELFVLDLDIASDSSIYLRDLRASHPKAAGHISGSFALSLRRLKNRGGSGTFISWKSHFPIRISGTWRRTSYGPARMFRPRTASEFW